MNEEDEAVVHMWGSKRVESVFRAHYTCQPYTAVVVQEQLQSQASVKVNSFVAINSFPCRLLEVQKKLVVESGQIVLLSINRQVFLLVILLKFKIHLSVLCSPSHFS